MACCCAERNIAVLIELRFALVGFGARKLRLRLDQSGIGLRELRFGLRELSNGLILGGLQAACGSISNSNWPFADERTFGVILLEQVAGDLRP